MGENLFQNKNVDAKLKFILKAMIAVLFVNNVFFGVFTVATGHALWIIIPIMKRAKTVA